MSDIGTNEEALRELDADNASRAQALGKMGAHVRNVESCYTNYLLEALVVKLGGGPGALTEVQLGYSGVVSRMLDDAEKQVEAHKSEAAKPKLSLPGQPW